jgi:O-methyltransferase
MPTSAKRAVREVLRRYRPALLYPSPQSSLQPERLYAYLDALWRRRDLDGAVVEVGCWLGGTAAIADKMLRRIDAGHRYVCVDTFSGFAAPQFAHDCEVHGVPAGSADMFGGSSRTMVRRLLQHYGCPDVELVQGDICSMPEHRLPDAVAVCLLDVDLELPIYEGLRRVVPRLVPGGVVLVDDCPEETTWAGARVGYRRYVQEEGLPERYFMGFGLVERDGVAANS